uniref:Predicted protein n=1 Tax=Hordeum vulgare subsp. vulgare TaxID=112509 RepID=F2ELR4_HORVV|nr:predicted protein [Hordeum vulgare subsp. vulgare]
MYTVGISRLPAGVRSTVSARCPVGLGCTVFCNKIARRHCNYLIGAVTNN